jgi:hypothetical protein
MIFNNNSNSNTNTNNLNSAPRIFTIVDFPEDNQTYGRFSSVVPKKAANKAFSAITKVIMNNENNDDYFIGKFIVFVIRDIKNNKEYKYIGNKIKLENPIVVYKDGKEVKYNYKNVIGKYSEELDKI